MFVCLLSLVTLNACSFSVTYNDDDAFVCLLHFGGGWRVLLFSLSRALQILRTTAVVFEYMNPSYNDIVCYVMRSAYSELVCYLMSSACSEIGCYVMRSTYNVRVCYVMRSMYKDLVCYVMRSRTRILCVI